MFGLVRIRARKLIDPLFEVPALVTTWVTAAPPTRGEPTVELSGELVIRDGIVMRVTLGPRCNRYGGPEEVVGSRDLALARRGTAIRFPKQKVSTDAGSNPLVSLLLRDWNGSDAGAEMPIGWLGEVR